MVYERGRCQNSVGLIPPSKDDSTGPDYHRGHGGSCESEGSRHHHQIPSVILFRTGNGVSPSTIRIHILFRQRTRIVCGDPKVEETRGGKSKLECGNRIKHSNSSRISPHSVDAVLLLQLPHASQGIGRHRVLAKTQEPRGRVLPPGFEPGYRAFTGLPRKRPREARMIGRTTLRERCGIIQKGLVYINLWGDSQSGKSTYLDAVMVEPVVMRR